MDKEMDKELIHLGVSTLPTLQIIGAYLDSKQTLGHAAHIQARLEKKIEDKPTELPKTRLCAILVC